MAKRIDETVKVTLEKNTLLEKGGAWLLEISIVTEGSVYAKLASITAWSNPSAAKRYLKTIIQENTPRKNVKLSVAKTDENDKPFSFTGELLYKVDAQ